MNSKVSIKTTVLVADDEFAKAITGQISSHCDEVIAIGDLKEARQNILDNPERPVIVVLDLYWGGTTEPSSRFVQWLQANQTSDDTRPAANLVKAGLCGLIQMSAFADTDEAREIITMGVGDYLGKPINTAELLARLQVLEATMANLRRSHELPCLADDGVIGEDSAFLEAYRWGRAAAPFEHPLLVYGETGTGKEAFVNAIHNWSERRGKIVAIDCAALFIDHDQPFLSKRKTLVDWLFEIGDKLEQRTLTIHQAVRYLDIVLHNSP